MKIRCQTQPLRDTFQLASSVASARSTKPILANVKLVAAAETTEILATDLEVAIRCNVEGVEVLKEGVTVVNAMRLANILRECDDEHVTLESTELVTKISYTNADYTLQGSDPDEFPPITEYDPKEAVELNRADLQKMIRYTAFSASRDTTSFALNGLYFVLRANEIRLVGADRHRLAYIKKKASNPEKAKTEVIVPTKAMEQLERMMVEDDETVGVKILDKEILFNLKRGVVAALLVEGKYPDYENVVPKDCDHKATIDAQTLLHSVRKAAPVAPDESKSVCIKLTKGQLVVTSTASEIGSAEIEVPIDYTGGDVHVAFNPVYLTDLLKGVEEESVQLELKDAESPGVVRVGKDYVYVIMPMHIED